MIISSGNSAERRARGKHRKSNIRTSNRLVLMGRDMGMKWKMVRGKRERDMIKNK